MDQSIALERPTPNADRLRPINGVPLRECAAWPLFLRFVLWASRNVA